MSEQIKQYIEQYKSQYSRDQIKQALISAGHKDIDTENYLKQYFDNNAKSTPSRVLEDGKKHSHKGLKNLAIIFIILIVLGAIGYLLLLPMIFEKQVESINEKVARESQATASLIMDRFEANEDWTAIVYIRNQGSTSTRISGIKATSSSGIICEFIGEVEISNGAINTINLNCDGLIEKGNSVEILATGDFSIPQATLLAK